MCRGLLIQFRPCISFEGCLRFTPHEWSEDPACNWVRIVSFPDTSLAACSNATPAQFRHTQCLGSRLSEAGLIARLQPENIFAKYSTRHHREQCISVNLGIGIDRPRAACNPRTCPGGCRVIPTANAPMPGAPHELGPLRTRQDAGRFPQLPADARSNRHVVVYGRAAGSAIRSDD